MRHAARHVKRHAALRGHGVPCPYEIEVVAAFRNISAKIFGGHSDTQKKKPRAGLQHAAFYPC